jgi:hypothetical protein
MGAESWRLPRDEDPGAIRDLQNGARLVRKSRREDRLIAAKPAGPRTSGQLLQKRIGDHVNSFDLESLSLIFAVHSSNEKRLTVRWLFRE